MKTKVITLQRDAYSDAYTHEKQFFLCTDCISQALTTAPPTIKLRISRWKPFRAKHWMQVTIGENLKVIALAQSPSLTDFVQQYTFLPAFRAFHALVASYPHPIYLSLLS